MLLGQGEDAAPAPDSLLCALPRCIVADARSNAHSRTGKKTRLRWSIPRSCCLYCCSAHAAALVRYHTAALSQARGKVQLLLLQTLLAVRLTERAGAPQQPIDCTSNESTGEKSFLRLFAVCSGLFADKVPCCVRHACVCYVLVASRCTAATDRLHQRARGRGRAIETRASLTNTFDVLLMSTRLLRTADRADAVVYFVRRLLLSCCCCTGTQDVQNT